MLFGGGTDAASFYLKFDNSVHQRSMCLCMHSPLGTDLCVATVRGPYATQD